MADPVSAGLAAAGSVIQGTAGYESGKFNKKAAYLAATQAQQDGADQETAIRERARAAIGAQVAAQGESGFQQGTGSALDALAASQVNATLDALTVRRQAAAEARSRRVSGDVAMAAGKNALVQGMIGAGAKVASYSSDWASARAGSTPAAAGGYGGGGYGSGADPRNPAVMH